MFKSKKKPSKKYYIIRNIVVSLIIGFTAGVATYHNIRDVLFSNSLNNTQEIVEIQEATVTEEPKVEVINPIKIDTCFTPPAGCGKIISELIAKANQSIYVQAYGFTSIEIIDALIDAHNRGVEVKILLDKSNLYSKSSQMPRIKKAGINVSIDNVPGIAHNKVIIIDQKTVITGSFNLSKNADYKNAENVIIITDPIIAEQYFSNWLSRKHTNENNLQGT